MRLSDRTLAITAAAGAGVQVGFGIAATRAVVHELGPFLMAFLRYAFALACFLPFGRPVLTYAPPVTNRLPLVLLGILQFGVLMALLNIGLMFLPAAVGAIIFSSLPLVTLVIAWPLGRESMNAFTLCSIALVVAGVFLAVGELTLSRDDPTILLGVLAVAAATLCGAASSVLYGQYAMTNPIGAVVVTGLTSAVVFLLPLALLELHSSGFRMPSLQAWWITALVGASSAVGFYLWVYSLARAPATSVAIA